MQSALEALNQYRTITAQFPNKYLEQCRSYLWEHCLDDIVIGDKEITHDK
jgi:PI-3-kinase-related kinase SMG-1